MEWQAFTSWSSGRITWKIIKKHIKLKPLLVNISGESRCPYASTEVEISCKLEDDDMLCGGHFTMLFRPMSLLYWAMFILGTSYVVDCVALQESTLSSSFGSVFSHTVWRSLENCLKQLLLGFEIMATRKCLNFRSNKTKMESFHRWLDYLTSLGGKNSETSTRDEPFLSRE